MISLFGSNVGDEELAAIKECFDRQWLGIGPKTAEFETKMAEKLGVPSFVLLNSGSNSLHLALALLELPEGSEVILPSFTWIACANAVQLNRLTPVFCDVDVATCNMRPEDVAPKITPKTSAIMVVHYAGLPAGVDALKTFGLPIVEDAAHAIDSFDRGRHCGTMGDAGIFSFDAVKNLTTGEGGGVTTADPERLARARRLRYCGIAKSGFEASATKSRWWEYDISDSFPKMLNTDIGAAIGLVQLRRLPGFQRRRRDIWERYTHTFTTESWANTWLDVPPGPEAGDQHSYFSYCIRLRAGSRDRLAKFLYERDVYTSLRFHPLHLNAIYGSHDRLPNCEWLNEHALNIPLHHRMTDAEVSQVLDGLRDFRKAQV